MTATLLPPPAPASAVPVAPGRLARVWRGRPGDPAWVRPALVALLAGTAVLYLWSLSDSGWANAYYSAAVQAASQSWKAFLFGASDAAGSITIDKAPLFLWPSALAARVFGVSSWTLLAPQALAGVASVGLLYLAVRRSAGAAAGLLAGAVLALTPVAALMFRFNNPDAMLVLLLTLGAYATVRAIEGGATRWVVLAGACVGLGFLAKMLQAFLVLPAFGLAYLVAAPGTVFRRLRQLLVAGVAVVVSAGWWVALVELWPASSRPYVGGSQENSLLELVFGYNGFGRLTGDETGSVGGGAAGTAGRWGATGLGRLFNPSFGGQISWLLPAALILLAALLVMTARARRTDRTRAAALLWGGWLVVTGLAISLGRGIIHEYYTVALAPAIGALVGIGAVQLWRRRTQFLARAALAGTVAVTGWWASELLSRTPDWNPWLRPAVLVGSALASVALVLPVRRAVVLAGAAALGVAVSMAGPVAYSWATVTTPHSGALPTAGPNVPGARGGGGGGPGGFAGGGPGAGGAFPGGTGGAVPSRPGDGGGAAGTGRGGDGGGAAAGGGGGGIGGILGSSEPSAALTAVLGESADQYRWVAAVVSANQAAGYQLATGASVMPIGGFNGTDPSPTLEQFQQYVADGDIHWFIAGGSSGGGGGSSSAAAEITAWVTATFEATTVDGVTLYDLSAG